MKNSKTDKEIDMNYNQLIALHEVSQKINSQLNLQVLLDEIMDQAVNLLKSEKGLILLSNNGNKNLEVQVARAMDKQTILNVVEMSRSIIDKVVKNGESILLEKIPLAAPSDSMMRYKIKSLLCVALGIKDRIVGVIYLDTSNPSHFFKKQDLLFLEAFANLASIAIENAKNYQVIDNLNKNLEKKVAARTEQLRNRNHELSNAYQEVKNTQLQLIRSEKMASLGRLVAGIAHEINTPLGAIYSNVDTILRSFEKMESTKWFESLKTLSSSTKIACEKIMGIVTNLRKFARLDEEEFKEVDIHCGIDSSLELLKYLREGRIELVKDYGKLPNIFCQAAQINQVFMNILLNAYQSIEGPGKIFIKTVHKNGTIHLEFKDTGPGIPKENIEKIFDPGFTTKGVGVGTGLGLSIAYKIIEDHGGSIQVKSDIGKGTNFSIELPIKG